MKIAGIPITQWIEKSTGSLTGPVTRWMQSLVDSVNSTTQQVNSVSDAGLTASVATTAFQTSANLPAGPYRVNYAMWLTRAAGVNSSLTFTATWTNNAQTFTQSGAALTTNTLTSHQNNTFTFSIDAATMVSYGIAYVSAGVPAMRYDYFANLESLP